MKFIICSQSHVKVSFEDEFGTFKNNIGTHFILSVIKELKPDCNFILPPADEMFGQVKSSPQDENTPFNPVSPYSISKVAGFELTKMYREAYKIFGCSGIFLIMSRPAVLNS